MTPNARFQAFLIDINPSKTTNSLSKKARALIVQALSSDPELGSEIVSTFLAGSYKRKTAIRPKRKDGNLERPDIDLYVVVDAEPFFSSPRKLSNKLYNALNRSRRSLGIRKITRNRCSVSVAMDISDIDISILLNRRSDGLFRIGNRETGEWYKTDPIEHNNWSTIENTRCSGNLKPMVKLMKWARRENKTKYKHPKSFALEVLIADLMNEKEQNMGKSFHIVCDQFLSTYKWSRWWERCPKLQDPSVRGGNLFHSVTGAEFCAFYDKIEFFRDTAALALQQSNQVIATKYWRKIFGPRFPEK